MVSCDNIRRVTVFAGHYGSGKTNLAINYALMLRKSLERVAIADLDIVNPYFRTEDSRTAIEEAGVRFISSRYANSNAELPQSRQNPTLLLKTLPTIRLSMSVVTTEVRLCLEGMHPSC